MQHSHLQLIEKFYTAFQKRDYVTMRNCYHEDIEFSDPAFPLLKGKDAGYMWEMLLTRSLDLKLEFSNIQATDTEGSCRWDAWYTFSKTRNKVHNQIDAKFIFKDGKIYRHVDTFSFHRWAGQALGWTGKLLGWTSFLKNKVQKIANDGLAAYKRNKGYE